jgi:hypothetical protein
MGGGYCAAVLVSDSHTLSISNTDFYENEGPQQAGLCIGSDDGNLDIEFESVDIYENIGGDGFGTYAIGPLFIFDGMDITMSFTDTSIFDNDSLSPSSAPSGSFLVSAVSSVRLNWSKSIATASSGIWGNITGGLTLQSSGTLEVNATDIDLGDNGTGKENIGSDIRLDQYSSDEISSQYRAEDESTFYCKDYQCGHNRDGDKRPEDDNATYTIGATSSAGSQKHSNFLGGNIFTATSLQTLNTFSGYYTSNSACTYDFYVFETQDVDGDGSVGNDQWVTTWVDHEVTHKGSGGWRDSEYIGNLFPKEKYNATAGKKLNMYYALAVAWSCEEGAAGDTETAQAFDDDITSKPDDMGIGQSYGLIESQEYMTSARYYVGDVADLEVTVPRTGGETSIYLMRVNTQDLN